MLYLINIHWERRSPHPDKPAKGRKTYAIAARFLKRAINQAEADFRRQYGANLRITSSSQIEDPAGIFSNR